MIPFSRQLAGAAHVVLEVGVAAVDDDVARLRVFSPRAAHHVLGGRARGHHHPRRARGLEPRDEFVERARSRATLGHEVRHGGRVQVVDDALVATLEQAAYHVAPHAAESDHADLHRSSLVRDSLYLPRKADRPRPCQVRGRTNSEDPVEMFPYRPRYPSRYHGDGGTSRQGKTAQSWSGTAAGHPVRSGPFPESKTVYGVQTVEVDRQGLPFEETSRRPRGVRMDIVDGMGTSLHGMPGSAPMLSSRPDMKRSSLLLMILLLLAGCTAHQAVAPASEGPAAMNAIAEAYVKLVLAVGQHDGDYVDAFYGPAEWRTAGRVREAAAAGDPLGGRGPDLEIRRRPARRERNRGGCGTSI